MEQRAAGTGIQPTSRCQVSSTSHLTAGPPACRCCMVRSSSAAKCMTTHSGGGACGAGATTRCTAAVSVLPQLVECSLRASMKGSDTCHHTLSGANNGKAHGSPTPLALPAAGPGTRSAGLAGCRAAPAAPPARCCAGPAAAQRGLQTAAAPTGRPVAAPPAPYRCTCAAEVVRRDGVKQPSYQPPSFHPRSLGFANPSRTAHALPMLPHHSQGQGGASRFNATSEQSPSTPWYTRAYAPSPMQPLQRGEAAQQGRMAHRVGCLGTG